MTHSIRISWLLLGTGILITTSPVLAEPGYDALMKQAKQNISDDKLEEADKAFEQAYRLASNDNQKALALAKRGEMMVYYQKKFTQAKEMVNYARRFPQREDQTNIILFQVEAACKMKGEKKYKEATVFLLEASKLDTDDTSELITYMMLGDCYRLDKQYQKALDAYTQVTQLSNAAKDGRSAAHMNSGIIYQYRLKKNDLAKAEYKKAVALNPSLKSQTRKLIDSME